MTAINIPVTYRIQAPGCVPLFEEHDVRAEMGYTLEAWAALGPRGRAFEIAVARIRNMIALHRADAEAQHAQSAARSRGARR